MSFFLPWMPSIPRRRVGVLAAAHEEDDEADAIAIAEQQTEPRATASLHAFLITRYISNLNAIVNFYVKRMSESVRL